MISEKTKENIARLREQYGTTPETNPDAIAGMKEYWRVIEEYEKKQLAGNPTPNKTEGSDKSLIWNEIMAEADQQRAAILPIIRQKHQAK